MSACPSLDASCGQPQSVVRRGSRLMSSRLSRSETMLNANRLVVRTNGPGAFSSGGTDVGDDGEIEDAGRFLQRH